MLKQNEGGFSIVQQGEAFTTIYKSGLVRVRTSSSKYGHRREQARDTEHHAETWRLPPRGQQRLVILECGAYTMEQGGKAHREPPPPPPAAAKCLAPWLCCAYDMPATCVQRREGEKGAPPPPPAPPPPRGRMRVGGG